MQSPAAIAALIVASALALPPQWCQAFGPLECCAACAEEEDCGQGESGETPAVGCECGNVPYKQPDPVTPIAIIPFGIATQPALYGGMSTLAAAQIPPPRNLQQLLCCWRN